VNNSFDDEDNDFFIDDEKPHGFAREVEETSRSIACRPSRLNNAQRRMLAEELGGITPMQILMSIARDEAAPLGMRVDACKVLMPYVHKKMPVAMETVGAARSVLNFDLDQLGNVTDEEIEHALGVLEKLGVQTAVIDAEARRID